MLSFLFEMKFFSLKENVFEIAQVTYKQSYLWWHNGKNFRSGIAAPSFLSVYCFSPDKWISHSAWSQNWHCWSSTFAGLPAQHIPHPISKMHATWPAIYHDSNLHNGRDAQGMSKKQYKEIWSDYIFLTYPFEYVRKIPRKKI